MFRRKKQREELITQIVEEVNKAPTVKEKLKVMHDTACNEEKQKMLIRRQDLRRNLQDLRLFPSTTERRAGHSPTFIM